MSPHHCCCSDLRTEEPLPSDLTPTHKHTHRTAQQTLGGIEFQLLDFSMSLQAGVEVSTPANAHKKCGILIFWTQNCCHTEVLY